MVQVAVVLTVLVTAVIVVVVAYGSCALGVRARTRRQTMPVGPPLAAGDEVVLPVSPAAARELVVDVLAARGLHARLDTSSQLAAAPALFPSGPFGRLVFVWYQPSVGVDATSTRLVLEAQEIMQGRRRPPVGAPPSPACEREVAAVVAALTERAPASSDPPARSD